MYRLKVTFTEKQFIW